MSDFIKVERSGAVATVVLNRPERLNAVSKPMWKAIDVAFTALSSDDSLRCIIVRGAGEKAFSAGADISEFATDRCDKARAADYGRVVHAAAAAIENCRHPIVAQIHGVCVGGGLVLAALCDMRICGESSRFGAPVKPRVGRSVYGDGADDPPHGSRCRTRNPAGGPRVRRRRGKRKATRVARGRRRQGRRGSMGNGAAGRRRAPLAARWHKKFVRRLAAPVAISDAEYDECFDCFDTEDFRIGYQAFLAKQRPDFVGR